MLSTLVRHAEAGAPTTELGDSGRCLTVRGRDQARATGRALAERGVAPTHAFSSPLVRALQTSELILAQLDYGGVVEARDDLYPGSSPDGLIEALADLPDAADVLVVGHMPYVAGAAGTLLGLAVSGLSTAEAYRIELTDLALRRARGQLRWRFAGRFID